MNGMWGQVLSCLIIVLEWLMCAKLAAHIGKCVKNKKANRDLSINIVVICTLYLLKVDPNVRIITAILLSIIYMIRNCRVSKVKATLVGIMFWLIMITLDALAMVIVMLLNQLDNPSAIFVKGEFTIQCILVSKLLAYGIIIMITKLTMIYEEFPKKYFLYLLFPLIANMINLFFLYSSSLSKQGIFSTRMVLVISTFATTVSTVIFILLQGTIINEQKERTQFLLLNDKLQMQYKYYENLQKEQERVRKLYHDMRNHISCIQLLANNKAANEYVKKINKELEDIREADHISTGSPILDVILTDKKRECNEKGIQFCSQVDFEKCDFVEMIDVTSLFSNIINNAIEACDKVKATEERTIRLKSTYVDDFFVLVAANAKENDIYIEEGNFVTSKQDSFIHGLGTKNIREVVEKYNGQVKFEYTKNEFKVKIYLPISIYVNQIAK
jgi:signal transduction histidine kinase